MFYYDIPHTGGLAQCCGGCNMLQNKMTTTLYFYWLHLILVFRYHPPTWPLWISFLAFYVTATYAFSKVRLAWKPAEDLNFPHMLTFGIGRSHTSSTNTRFKSFIMNESTNPCSYLTLNKQNTDVVIWQIAMRLVNRCTFYQCGLT